MGKLLGKRNQDCRTLFSYRTEKKAVTQPWFIRISKFQGKKSDEMSPFFLSEAGYSKIVRAL